MEKEVLEYNIYSASDAKNKAYSVTLMSLK